MVFYVLSLLSKYLVTVKNKIFVHLGFSELIPAVFVDSIEMTENLVSHGRKLVTIVDPHIKKDSGYWVHNDLTSKEFSDI